MGIKKYFKINFRFGNEMSMNTIIKIKEYNKLSTYVFNKEKAKDDIKQMILSNMDALNYLAALSNLVFNVNFSKIIVNGIYIFF